MAHLQYSEYCVLLKMSSFSPNSFPRETVFALKCSKISPIRHSAQPKTTAIPMPAIIETLNGNKPQFGFPSAAG